MAASRSAGSGSMYQMPVPAAAVVPDVPQNPLSASTTRAPCSAALIAAHVPAGPPPRTRTSASYSTEPAEDESFSARPVMDRSPHFQFRAAQHDAASHNIAWGHASGNFRYLRGFGRSFHRQERRKKIHVAAHVPFSFAAKRSSTLRVR